jgi:tetratricopeptide (TPR) repeat protein
MFLTVVFCLCLPIALAAAPADPKQIYDEANEALYNLDFNKAEPSFAQLTRDYPANPDYWNALASTVWLRILYEQQKLNMESFSSRDSFGTGDSKEAVDPKLEERLRGYIDQSIKASDAMLKANPRNVQALYAKGVANGTLASFEGTVKRAYMAAGSRAKAARNLHQEVLRLDPSFHDAELSIGIYNYVVGAAPGWARYTVLFALGLTGDGKAQGIRQLESAAAKGRRATSDAKMLLVVVYNREGRHAESLKLLDELLAKYPRNFMFEMAKASVHGKMKQWDRAIGVYNDVIEKVRTQQEGYDKLRIEKVYSELGTSQIHGFRFNDAQATFALVVAGKAATPNEKASAHLWMGKMFDTSNKREEAIKHYRAIESLNCDPSFKEEARKYQRKAFA